MAEFSKEIARYSEFRLQATEDLSYIMEACDRGDLVEAEFSDIIKNLKMSVIIFDRLIEDFERHDSA